jgi:phosphoglycerate dehydrogenase-like enzyme
MFLRTVTNAHIRALTTQEQENVAARAAKHIEQYARGMLVQNSLSTGTGGSVPLIL